MTKSINAEQLYVYVDSKKQERVITSKVRKTPVYATVEAKKTPVYMYDSIKVRYMCPAGYILRGSNKNRYCSKS